MATLLPPPKRPKIYHGVEPPEPKPIEPVPNVVVQFVSEEDGSTIAPPVNLPANLTKEALEQLVNKFSSTVCSRTLAFLRLLTQYFDLFSPRSASDA
jgi:ribosome assembly protein 4